MSRKDDLGKIVRDLMYQNTEGEYWDFKEYPYFYDGQEKREKDKKRKDLLHDIICMSNNLSNREAYLIMGVSDNPIEIKGVNHFKNRWSQEKYLDFIQAKKWAGDNIPSLEFVTVDNGNGKELDVLVIHKSSQVPYYLKENYKGVIGNKIYVRKGAKNTSIDKQAEMQDIEKLWAYRFGLIPYPKERMLNYVRDVELWEEMRSDGTSRKWYYHLFPEYVIELSEDPENERLRTPHFALMHTSARSDWQVLRLKYHQTVLSELTAHVVDGGRGIVVQPHISLLKIFKFDSSLCSKNNYFNSYYYYIKDSFEIHLLWFFKEMKDSSESYSIWLNHLQMIPIFENLQEKEELEIMINNDIQKYQKMQSECKNYCFVGHGSDLSESDIEYARNDMATSVMVKKMLESVRKNKLKNRE